jgi:hypothetical protein
VKVYILMEAEPEYGTENGYRRSPISVHQDKGDADTARAAKVKWANGRGVWDGGHNIYTVEGPFEVDQAGRP